MTFSESGHMETNLSASSIITSTTLVYHNLSLGLSTEEVHFLEVTVKLHNVHIDNIVILETYSLPCLSICFLLPLTHTTKSIIYSQFLCNNHTCLDPLESDVELVGLNQAFRRTNYLPNEINRQINGARSIDGEELNATQTKPQNTTDCYLLFSAQTIINKLQPIEDNDRGNCLMLHTQSEANTHKQ